MLQHLIDYHLDVAGFAVLLFAAAGVVHVRLRRRHGAGVAWSTWLLLAVITATGAAAARFAGTHERDRLRDMLQGIAPTYAQELERMGHARVMTETSPDDPQYLAMIDAQVRWTRANPNVADVYTLRMQPDESVVLLVDSETDYDRDGRFDEDREARTDIGEAYEGDLTEGLRQAFEGMTSFDPVPETDRWGTWVSAFVPMRDASGAVEGVLGVDYDASQWLSAIAWSRAAALGFVGLTAVVAIASAAVVAVTRAELKERERLQRELVDASRQAGMAEVATGVLHNVGNVLNSVNVSAGVLAERLRGSKVPAFAKAAGLLRERRADLGAFLSTDQKGKVLPDYLLQLAELMSREQDEMLGELNRLAGSIGHIKQVVAAQQSYARAADVVERFDVRDVVEEALHLSTEAFGRHGIEIVRRFEACPPVTADRHKALQVIVNLLSNAKDAMRGQPAGARTIELRIAAARSQDCGGGEVARVSVTDAGVGIRPDDLPKLFRYGFTTRTDGHGFGLHFCANAARQMKGSLTAHSEGPGRGATFTFDIPFARQTDEVPA